MIFDHDLSANNGGRWQDLSIVDSGIGRILFRLDDKIRAEGRLSLTEEGRVHHVLIHNPISFHQGKDFVAVTNVDAVGRHKPLIYFLQRFSGGSTPVRASRASMHNIPSI